MSDLLSVLGEFTRGSKLELNLQAVGVAWYAAGSVGPTPMRFRHSSWQLVAVYPACDRRDVWALGVPVLVLLGEADDITTPESCDRILRRLPYGTEVQVRRYADARHGFDFTGGPEVLSIGGGMTVGRNPSAGEQAWEEIFAFLGSN